MKYGDPLEPSCDHLVDAARRRELAALALAIAGWLLLGVQVWLTEGAAC